jgi:hypothetical protein
MEVPQNVQAPAKVPRVKEVGKHCSIVYKEYKGYDNFECNEYQPSGSCRYHCIRKTILNGDDLSV